MGKKRLLVIGGLPDDVRKCQYGGATVLMRNFKQFLETEGVPFVFVQTNRYSDRNGKSCRLLNAVDLCLNFVRSIFLCDRVMFNFSDNSTVRNYPFLSSVASMLGRIVILRKFGGSFDTYLEGVGRCRKRRCIRALNRAAIIYAETGHSVSHIRSLVGNPEKVHRFPNVRRPASRLKNSPEMNHRLAFMSHILDEKGVGDLIAAAAKLPDGYTVDLYGAIKEDKYRGYDFKAVGVNYKGEITSETVMSLLPEYQFLLLPSYREGYPGIIIEAMSVGTPVIATTVGGIPEMITDGYNGLLVVPGDVAGLCDRIVSVTAAEYGKLCLNALKTFNGFYNSDTVNPVILNEMMNVRAERK
mgnify:CR=1 FL=1